MHNESLEMENSFFREFREALTRGLEEVDSISQAW